MTKIETYRRLIILRAQLEKIVFKEFFKQYDMPKGLKQVHGMTLLKLKYRKIMSMTELSQALNLEKASVTTIADKLLQSGLIESKRSNEDRRVYNLTLTKLGLDFANRFEKHHQEFLSNKFEEYTSKEVNKLCDSLEYITDMFEEIL